MIPSSKQNIVTKNKVVEKNIEAETEMKCNSCSKSLTNKAQKNSLTDNAIYMIVKIDENKFLPYCSKCTTLIPFNKIDQIENYKNYQKKLKVGLI